MRPQYYQLNGSASFPTAGSFRYELGERAWTFAKQQQETSKGDVHDRRFAQPQRVGEKEFFGERWGVTREQCMELLAELRSLVAEGEWDPDGSVYDWVQQIIKPRTAGKGIGYCLLLNSENPPEVNTMVSHAWNENAIDFLEAICRSTRKDDVLFICALSIYQNEDGAGPSIADQLGCEPRESPFQRVLENIGANGTKNKWTEFWYAHHYAVINSWYGLGLCLLALTFLPMVLDGVVYTFSYSAVKTKVCLKGSDLASCETVGYVWVWKNIWPWFRLCLPMAIIGLLIWIAMGVYLWYIPIYRGRMIVTPNRQIDIYTRLWCVYEIFIARKLKIPIVLARTMAPVGQSSSAYAVCSSADDKERIHKEIVAAYGDEGFAKIDKSIQKLTNELKWDVFRMVWTWGLPLVIVGLGYYNMFDPDDCQKEFWGDALGLFSVVIVMVVSYYIAFKKGGGVIAWRTLAFLAAIQLFFYIVFTAIRYVTKSLKTECDGTFSAHSARGLTLAFIFGFSKAVSTGLCVAFLCSFCLLLYTYFRRGPRALERSCMMQSAFFCLGVVYCVARESLAPHGLPSHLWKYPNQAFPEALYVVTEFAAVLGLPMNAIWISSLFWGLQVEWESPANATVVWSSRDADEAVEEAASLSEASLSS